MHQVCAVCACVRVPSLVTERPGRIGSYQRAAMLCPKHPLPHLMRFAIHLHLLCLRVQGYFPGSARELARLPACGCQRVGILCPSTIHACTSCTSRCICSASACFPWQMRQAARLPAVISVPACPRVL